MKRLTAVMVLVCMFFLLVMPVGAAEVEGTASYSGFMRYHHVSSGGNFRGDLSFPRSANSSILRDINADAEVVDLDVEVVNVPPSVGVVVSGVVGVYFSYAYTVANGVTTMRRVDTDETLTESAYSSSVNETMVFDFYDRNGDLFPADIKSFEAQRIAPYKTVTVNVSSRVSLDEGQSVTGFYYSPSSVYCLSTQFAPQYVKLWFPSLSVIATQSSMELDALENMASQITQQNRILEAMQGDIIALLQQISNKVSTEETLRLATQYLLEISAYSQQISSDLQSVYTLLSTYLHYLQQIAETADDIYAELQAFHDDFLLKLDLLISTIMTESDDIQATMDRIYQQLIAYLDATYTEAINPEYEDSRLELDQGIQDNHAIEQQWTGSLSDAWTAMNIQSHSFDAGITSGFMWVSSWFSNIYNAAGIYGAVLILPLLVGICKLLLGMFRFAGHGSREEDDDA